MCDASRGSLASERRIMHGATITVNAVVDQGQEECHGPKLSYYITGAVAPAIGPFGRLSFVLTLSHVPEIMDSTEPSYHHLGSTVQPTVCYVRLPSNSVSVRELAATRKRGMTVECNRAEKNYHGLSRTARQHHASLHKPQKLEIARPVCYICRTRFEGSKRRPSS